MPKRILLIVLACMVLLGPAVGLVGVGVLATPGTQAHGAGCLPAPTGKVTGPLADDAPVPKRARAWIRKAARTCPDLPETWIAAVMYQETNFRPGLFADDVNGGTWGLFQLNRYIWRNVYGPWSADKNRNGVWDIKEPLIHSEYGAKYLCDLLRLVRQKRKDHPNWASTRRLSELDALVVAHNGGPGRLATYPDIAPVTRRYIRDVRRHIKQWAGPDGGERTPARSSRVVMPMAKGSYRITSPYGWRKSPFGSGRAFHRGLDFAGKSGTPILAVADGTVARAGMIGSGGAGQIDITHTIDRRFLATRYKHMWRSGIHVRPGQRVKAGQHIGDVGSSGHSTGAHLHLEIRPGGPGHATTDPAAWLKHHHAAHAHPSTPATAGGQDCRRSDEEAEGGAPRPFTGKPGGRLRDPTGTGGWITRQTAHLLAETKRAFPRTSWSCWYATSNKSEHPVGRACDVTFGNRIGQFPTRTQVARGWQVGKWLKRYAGPLRVKYLIWQRRIWSVQRNPEGWRLYDGGGLADPSTPTGGHYDHLHISLD